MDVFLTLFCSVSRMSQRSNGHRGILYVCSYCRFFCRLNVRILIINSSTPLLIPWYSTLDSSMEFSLKVGQSHQIQTKKLDPIQSNQVGAFLSFSPSFFFLFSCFLISFPFCNFNFNPLYMLSIFLNQLNPLYMFVCFFFFTSTTSSR